MTTFTEELQTALDGLGDTPMAEPELFKALDERSLKKSEILKLVLSRHDLKLKDYDSMVMAEFFNAVNTKITSIKNPDGSFKSTPATANMALPDFEEAEEVTELGVALLRLKEGMGAKLSESSDKKRVALVKETSAAIQDTLLRLNARVWEITGLNPDNLTEWEQRLVTAQLFMGARTVEQTSMGKPLED